MLQIWVTFERVSTPTTNERNNRLTIVKKLDVIDGVDVLGICFLLHHQTVCTHDKSKNGIKSIKNLRNLRRSFLHVYRFIPERN